MEKIDKFDVELTFKKKEVKAILRLLAKIAECEPEGINQGALELTIQQIEELLDRMKRDGRSIATVTLEVSESDFEKIQFLFERHERQSPEDDPVDIKDIHEIINENKDTRPEPKAAWWKPDMGRGPCVLSHVPKESQKPKPAFGTMPIPTAEREIKIVKKKNDDLDLPRARVSANTWAEQVAGTHLFGF